MGATFNQQGQSVGGTQFNSGGSVTPPSSGPNFAAFVGESGNTQRAATRDALAQYEKWRHEYPREATAIKGQSINTTTAMGENGGDGLCYYHTYTLTVWW